jgi:hypothetical protein
MIWFAVLILATGAERIVEVVLSNRHAACASPTRIPSPVMAST